LESGRRTTALLGGILLCTGLNAGYQDLILADGPVAYWRLDEERGRVARDLATNSESRLDGRVDDALLAIDGPRPERFPAFSSENRAALFASNREVIVVQDPGDESALDFDLGDSITIEAWIAPKSLGDGGYVYIVGKGRTENKGFATENQNWSLRLSGKAGTCRVSFLFRDADNRPHGHPEFSQDWHRWTSTAGIEPESGWHHVALSYTFGKGDSLHGYIDGVETKGVWDLGGKSDERPVVDNDDVWIGSSLGRNKSSTFDGGIDEVAIYRRALDAKSIRQRVQIDASVKPRRPQRPPPSFVDEKEIPDGTVLVCILEGIPAKDSWNFPAAPNETDRFTERVIGLIGVPRRYSSKGLIIDRSNPFLLRASTRVRFAGGEHRFLLRSFSSARLWIDGRLVAQTRFQTRNADGHEAVPDTPATAHPELRLLPPGHAEKLITVEFAEASLREVDSVDSDFGAGEHIVRLEAIIGGKGLRSELGELSVSVSKGDAPFTLVGHGETIALGDDAWEAYGRRSTVRLARLSDERRRRSSEVEDERWRKRHELARRYVRELPPIVAEGVEDPSSMSIDDWIERRLAQADAKPAPIIDDWSFLRRSSLDVRGLIPSEAETEAFFADTSADRRVRWIDRLLDDPGWADHWVAYWQDVLAENPGILKPKLNNSGPFRWWLHESFLDNKPIDRFVTELVLMEGSVYGGGPAGFHLATQNDVPMAAKAQILGQAFLGIEMKCARCHDAPFHPWKQRDLFQLAAMLKRGPQKVPKTSSVPRTKEELEDMIVSVTLPPGSKVKPAWPFADLGPASLDAELLLAKDDPRERVAATITSSRNKRFARVIVNRLWKRLMGLGFVEPVEDWESREVSHPALLEHLARELVANAYDLKHVTRLILNSRTYQREAQPDASGGDPTRVPTASERVFRGPVRRRMSAEQIIDSLFSTCEKRIGSEELNLDVDGRRPITSFLNLGRPERAWEFTSMSNERDRPALSMPIAQSIIDVLKAFGWRETRQDPITVREETPTVIQPLILAHGTVTHRVATLSDDSAFTELFINGGDLEKTVRAVFVRVLTRPPSAAELTMFSELLRDGFDERRRESPSGTATKRPRRHNVSWSNHLNAAATRIKLEMERLAREGDPPTQRLDPDWRARAEDFLWALLNSPEFVFIP
jgi:hypothetical protein